MAKKDSYIRKDDPLTLIIKRTRPGGEDQWHWELQNERGLPLARSAQTYTRRNDCTRQLAAIIAKIAVARTLVQYDDDHPEGT